MLLYVIRHGITEWNKLKRMQGQTDIPLAEEGISLALKTGEAMKNIELDYVISSPLTRAVQTAECIVKGRDIPIYKDDRIQEISFGEWEGECIEESDKIPSGYREQFFSDPIHLPCPPKGETFRDVQNRTGEFLEELCNRQELTDKKILISTHGAAGRCLLSHFFEDGETNIWRTSVPGNCTVCIVKITKEQRKVLEWDKEFNERK